MTVWPTLRERKIRRGGITSRGTPGRREATRRGRSLEDELGPQFGQLARQPQAVSRRGPQAVPMGSEAFHQLRDGRPSPSRY